MIKKQRNAFSLLIAIFVIMMLSLVASYIYYSSSSITKTGTIQYKTEQAKLYARSYTEYAILAIQSYDRVSNNNCIEKISQDIGNPAIGQGYRVKVLISYIGNQKYLPNSCPITASLSNTNSPDTLMAIIDVYVSYRDSQHMAIGTAKQSHIPWVTYHRRSLQKL